MHHKALYISEVLNLIFKFVAHSDAQSQTGPQVGKRTLASLARTCHLFSSPALDALWYDLYSFDPLLNVFPVVTSPVNDAHWSTFREYAKRVKALRSFGGRVPMHAKLEFASSLRHYPEVLLPLLPNVTELEWSEFSYSAPEDSALFLLRYFTSPTVTTISLSLMRWLAHSPTGLAILADLPRLCPNVTSFTAVIGFPWDCEPSRDVVRMVAQWPRLQTLRTRAIGQPMMDQLFAQQTLTSLDVAYYSSSPNYVGRIPDMIRKFTLSVETPLLFKRFFETVYASPTTFRLLGMIEGECGDLEEIFHILPRHLDTSRLLSFTIQPGFSMEGMLIRRTLTLRAPFVSGLVEFTSLHELDLDLLCTAPMPDGDYGRMAESLVNLRRLKLGTANPSVTVPWPVASIAAVMAILKHCENLETLHILFDGLIPPPGCSIVEGGRVALPEELARHGWGVSNRRITRLRIGYSPIQEATVNVMAHCLKSIMPGLVQIECKNRSERWELVQDMLKSGQSGRCRVY